MKLEDDFSLLRITYLTKTQAWYSEILPYFWRGWNNRIPVMHTVGCFTFYKYKLFRTILVTDKCIASWIKVALLQTSCYCEKLVECVIGQYTIIVLDIFWCLSQLGFQYIFCTASNDNGSKKAIRFWRGWKGQFGP